jgi:hypothetical protein
MATKVKDIKVVLLGEVYSCPACWTVLQVEEKIRSCYSLYGGGMACDGVVMLGTARLKSVNGELTFVGSKFTQSALGTRAIAGRRQPADSYFQRLWTAICEDKAKWMACYFLKTLCLNGMQIPAARFNLNHLPR